MLQLLSRVTRFSGHAREYTPSRRRVQVRLRPTLEALEGRELLTAINGASVGGAPDPPSASIAVGNPFRGRMLQDPSMIKVRSHSPAALRLYLR